MDDLLKQLRQAGSCDWYGEIGNELMQRAAKEIERLAAENNELHDQLGHCPITTESGDNPMKANEVKTGQKVSTSGFSGTITEVCEWSRTSDDVMVEVTLESGVVCVTCHDLKDRANKVEPTPELYKEIFQTPE